MTDPVSDLLATLLAATSAPSFHPALVHFPVALLPTALGFDLACLLLRRQTWLDRAASALYALGALGAGAAYLSGRAAANALLEVPGAAQATLAEHQRFALLVLVAAAVTALLRLLVSWLGRRDKRIAVGAFRLLALAASIATQGLLVVTADRGGALVYQHQLGAAAVQQRLLDTENLEP